MSSRHAIAQARNKLSRLDRKDVNGNGLSTVDPLMAEIMIANTLSNLAIAEATVEQTKVIYNSSLGVTSALYSNTRGIPNYGFSGDRHKGNSEDYFRLKSLEYQEKSLDNQSAVVKILAEIVDIIKKIAKLLGRK